MTAARTIALVIGILAVLDGLRRVLRGRGVNTWIFVGEMGVVGAAQGIFFADNLGDALFRSLVFFVVGVLGALLFDVWLERPQ